MDATGVRRIIVVSAIPVAPKEQTSPFSRAVVYRILRQFFGGAYDDMHRMETIITRSGLDWTVFRPPNSSTAPPPAATAPPSTHRSPAPAAFPAPI